MAVRKEREMKERFFSEAISRREALAGIVAVGTATALMLSHQPALAATDNGWQEALKKIVGDQTPVESGLTLQLPEIAENGNTVPFSISVDSPMTEDDYVKAVHVLSTGNPQPYIATFHFTPDSGKAAVSSRMRLAATQDVVSVAELSNGKFLIARKEVKVTIGGCGG
jgi:sulfur-oxidizing protein SoxY